MDVIEISSDSDSDSDTDRLSELRPAAPEKQQQQQQQTNRERKTKARREAPDGHLTRAQRREMARDRVKSLRSARDKAKGMRSARVLRKGDGKLMREVEQEEAEYNIRHEEGRNATRSRYQAIQAARTKETLPTAMELSEPHGQQPQEVLGDDAPVDAPNLPFPTAAAHDLAGAASPPVCADELLQTQVAAFLNEESLPTSKWRRPAAASAARVDTHPPAETAVPVAREPFPPTTISLAALSAVCTDGQPPAQTAVPFAAGAPPFSRDARWRATPPPPAVTADKQLPTKAPSRGTTKPPPPHKRPHAASHETLAPARLDPAQRLQPPVAGVSDPSGEDAAARQMPPPASRSALHQTTESPQRRRRPQDARRERAVAVAPPMTPLRAVLLHWGRLWRRPRDLYRHWLGRPLFRRAARRQDGEAVRRV